MKKRLRNIMSFLMALLVLFSTVSFTVDIHYCGKELVDFSILKPAQTCGMEMQQSDTSKPLDIVESNCCTNEHLVVEGQKEIKANSFEKFTFDQQALLVSYAFSSLNLLEGLKENIIPFKNYTPPLIVSEIQLENETFLI